ncbi:molybdopterin molybdotransferase, partial [Streptomyces sp. MnatMP-M27]
RTLTGRPAPAPGPAPLAEAVQGHPRDTRLVPVTFRQDAAVPLRFNGPAMLRGIAVADGLAVIPPGGAKRGTEVEVLDLPWSATVTEQLSHADQTSRGTDRARHGTDRARHGAERTGRGTNRTSRGTGRASQCTDQVSKGTDRTGKGTDQVSKGTDRAAKGTDPAAQRTPRANRNQRTDRPVARGDAEDISPQEGPA